MQEATFLPEPGAGRAGFSLPVNFRVGVRKEALDGGSWSLVCKVVRVMERRR